MKKIDSKKAMRELNSQEIDQVSGGAKAGVKTKVPTPLGNIPVSVHLKGVKL